MQIVNIAPEQNKKVALEIVKYLKEGKVLVFPTDTVYGLICDAGDENAVERIFKIKQRDRIKPLAVFVKNLAEAQKIAVIDGNQKKFLQDNWPGAMTVILQACLPAGRAKKTFLSKLVYQNGTIGLRIPDYPMLNLVLKEFKNPIAQTSANISGQKAMTKIKEVLEQFETAEIQPDVIINAGNLPESKPSKVVDFSKNAIKILRNN